MNIVRVAPSFGTMQSQNEFHLQPNSLFARTLHWTRGVTLNPCKRRWTTTWTWMNPDCNCDLVEPKAIATIARLSYIGLQISYSWIRLTCECQWIMLILVNTDKLLFHEALASLRITIMIELCSVLTSADYACASLLIVIFGRHGMCTLWLHFQSFPMLYTGRKG